MTIRTPHKQFQALAALVAVLACAGAASAETAAVGKLDDKTTGSTVRVSQLMGANIQNPQEESVGEISDLVIDAANGKVRYAAVTYGGVLGIGNKLFAVPWEAFRCVQDPDDADEYRLVLNVNQKTLDGAEGFDQDRWPNLADPALARQLDARYGVKRVEGVNVDVGNRGVDVDVKRN
jgi:sporulation protein YlmC with PRC-barrel domain